MSTEVPTPAEAKQIYENVQPDANPTQDEINQDINELQSMIGILNAKKEHLAGLKGEQQGTADNMDNATKELISMTDKVIQDMSRAVKRQMGKIAEKRAEITQKNEELMAKRHTNQLQQQEIEEKKQLVATRDRMLELSQEKNVYKQKVIYTLIAVIIAIICLLLISYAFLRGGTRPN